MVAGPHDSSDGSEVTISANEIGAIVVCKGVIIC